MLKRLPFLALLLPVLASAQGFNPHVKTMAGAGINWLGSFATAVDNLVTGTAGTLLGVGNVELAIFAACGLILMVIRWQVSVMNLWHHAHSFHMGDLYIYLFKIVAAEAMLTYYARPIFGAISFHQIFPYLFQQLTNGINLSIVKSFLDQMQVFTLSLQLPSIVNLPGCFIFFSVLIMIGFLQVALFVLNAFSFVAVGMLTFVGPLLIPFFVTKRFESRFWVWLDNMIVYSSYRMLAAGFTYVFAKVFMDFFTNSLNNDYSLGNLIALFPVLLMLTVAFIWSMFKIPQFASTLFGGAGSMGQQFSNDIQAFLMGRIGR